MRSDWTTAAVLAGFLTGCGSASTNAPGFDDSGPDPDPGRDADVRVDAGNRPDSPSPTNREDDAGHDSAAPSATVPDAADGSATLVPDAADASAPLVPDAAAPCDPTAPPSTSPCVLTEQYGLFVAPLANGGDNATGDGSRAHPFATIRYALGHLGALPRIYVCNGTYVDQVMIESDVSIFGGLDCTSSTGGDGGVRWTYVPGTTASVVGVSPQFALQVNAGDSAVDIEDMTWMGAWAEPGFQTSVAGWIVYSPSVTLRRTAFVGGEADPGEGGNNGPDGALATSVSGTVTATPASSAGSYATADYGGPATLCTCVDGSTSTGGAGGDLNDGYDGSTGKPTITGSTSLVDTGAGGTEAQCLLAEKGGSPGANSSAVGTDGAVASPGTLDVMGWHPGVGGAGGTGGTGQGGGGGGGSAAYKTYGGGGGCGGCGGGGGTGGSGGGASIGLLLQYSPVTLEAATVVATYGGDGGPGSTGGLPEPGGNGGYAYNAYGCNGGSGGSGAAGGTGAGGPGGLSVAILYTGAPPTLDAATVLIPGTAGVGGPGGNAGVNDGPAGVSGGLVSVATL